MSISVGLEVVNIVLDSAITTLVGKQLQVFVAARNDGNNACYCSMADAAGGFAVGAVDSALRQVPVAPAAVDPVALACPSMIWGVHRELAELAQAGQGAQEQLERLQARAVGCHAAQRALAARLDRAARLHVNLQARYGAPAWVPPAPGALACCGATPNNASRVIVASP